MIGTEKFDFDREVLQASRERPVLVVFEAGWSEACRKLDARLARIEHGQADRLAVLHLDVNTHADLARRLNVQGLPFVIAFRGGQPVGGFSGMPTEAAMRRFVARLLPPGAGTDEAIEGRAHLRAGRLQPAAAQLRLALALDPSRDAVRVDYVRALARAGRREDARRAFAALTTDPARAARHEALGRWLDALDRRAAAVSANGDHAALVTQALDAMAEERWGDALPPLLELLSRERDHDGLRRDFLAVLTLADDPALAGEWRRRLGAVLL